MGHDLYICQSSEKENKHRTVLWEGGLLQDPQCTKVRIFPKSSVRNLLWYQTEEQVQVLKDFQIVALKIIFSLSPKEPEALEIIHPARLSSGIS